MGHSHGKLHDEKQSPSNNNKNISFNPYDPVPSVTDSEVKLLKTMWAFLKEDIAKVGIITFVR